MPVGPKRPFRKTCRLYFRRFRISVWVLTLILLGFLLYLNQIGLPEFAKAPLLQKLHDRGISLQFSRLRVRWFQGIVADNVRFLRTDAPFSPQLALRELQVL